MPLISLTKVYYTKSGDHITLGLAETYKAPPRLVVFRQGKLIHGLSLEEARFRYYEASGTIDLESNVIDTLRLWTNATINCIA